MCKIKPNKQKQETKLNTYNHSKYFLLSRKCPLGRRCFYWKCPKSAYILCSNDEPGWRSLSALLIMKVENSIDDDDDDTERKAKKLTHADGCPVGLLLFCLSIICVWHSADSVLHRFVCSRQRVRTWASSRRPTSWSSLCSIYIGCSGRATPRRTRIASRWGHSIPVTDMYRVPVAKNW
jgi:hypothetical protein